ncbi:GntR family transcriptional regulator [uncultured Devosia sp.]|uniref:GntR family transcriptional regulator n=1 Tax=uncultured Devosia sp. TaxID=211434 RepID=UPI0035CB53E1
MARTSAEDIRQQLAARIISGTLRPGMQLDETMLASDFAVSRTPVREALRLLRASGLVQQRPHAKAQVAKPDEATLAGMFEVMGYLEALCAGLCAIAMIAAERQALARLHEIMAGMVRDGDHQAYADANETFHSAIYDGAQNSYLGEITRSTRQRLQPFRRAQFQLLGRLGRSHAEHGTVLDAILQGDRTGAEQAMGKHISIVEHAYQTLDLL